MPILGSFTTICSLWTLPAWTSGKPNICMFCRMSKQSSSGTRDRDYARSLRPSPRSRIARNSWRNIRNGFARPIHRVRTGQFYLLSAACLWWRTASHFPDGLLKPPAKAFGTEFHAKSIKHGLYLSGAEGGDAQQAIGNRDVI